MKEKFYRFITGGLVVIWMIVIFCFSSQPAAESGKVSEGVCDKIVIAANQTFHMHMPEKQIRDIAVKIEYPIRKAAHMTEYAVLGLLSFAFYVCCGLQEKKRYAAALMTVMLYASTDEFHQLFVAGRTGKVTDVIIDTSGAVIAFLILFFVRKTVRKHCEKKKVHVQ